MNVAAIMWPVNQVRGINSWSENFISGAKKIGHNVQTFYCTSGKSFKCNPNKKLRRGEEWSSLPAKHLSYHTTRVKESIKTLNDFDVIVFLHICPHPTKSTMDSEHPRGWKRIFSDTTPKKIAIFHDSRWKKNNSWASEVAEYLNKIVAAQPTSEIV